MQILIADKFPEAQRAALAERNFEVVFDPGLGPDDLPKAIGEASVLIVRSTKVTAETIKTAKKLQLIIRAGAGTNTIDCKEAAACGIAVANCPGKNAIAVAELAIGLVVAIDRHIPDCVADIRAGKWNKATYGKANGLYGRTLGVVGVGRIGRETVKRGQGFGMNVIGFDPVVDDATFAAIGVTRCASLEELCKQADAICVHVPLNDATRHLISTQQLEWMRPGTLFVNASRGGVVDDAALAKSVESGHILAACDVYEEEPSSGQADFSTPLGKLPGFYGTHHIGASTNQAQSAVADAVLEIIDNWQQTGEVKNCVNLAKVRRSRGQLIVRHLDKVGVLASVLDVLKRANINVQEMSNTLFDGGVAASAKIQVERAPSPEELAEVGKASDDVLGVEFMASE